MRGATIASLCVAILATMAVAQPGSSGSCDPAGCPRALKGNSLVRSIPYFRDLGFATALVDSPSDLTGEDGLAGFRSSDRRRAGASEQPFEKFRSWS